MAGSKIPQPYKAQVFIKISGEVISVIPPDHVVSFAYFDNLMSGGDTFEFEIFDRSAFILENKLHRSSEIEMQWGYVGGPMSALHKGTMLSYEVTAIDGLQGVLMRVEGIDRDTDSASSVKKSRPWNRSQPIHEVAKQIADENGLGGKVGNTSSDPTATIEECEDVIDTTHSTKGDPNPKNRFQQTEESDFHFLKRLQDIAVSKHLHIGDYRFSVDASRRLHFRPLRLWQEKKQVQKRYIYPDPEGGVISFTPAISGSLVAKMGADTVIGRARHGTTGEEIVVVRDPQTLKVYSVDPKNPSVRKDVTGQLADGLGGRLNQLKLSPQLQKEFSTAAGQIRSTSEQVRDLQAKKNNFKSLPQLTANTPEMAAIEVHSWWTKYMGKFFEAELTVVGDPTLSPTNSEADMVDVTFVVKGIQHYTSGLYRVFSVLHSIDANGKYMSKMEMQSADVYRTRDK